MLPVRWQDDVLEQVDLDLDVLRTDGKVWVRDRDKFEQVRKEWPMPDEIASKAEETSERVRESAEMGTEPFGHVGQKWLADFLATSDPK